MLSSQGRKDDGLRIMIHDTKGSMLIYFRSLPGRYEFTEQLPQDEKVLFLGDIHVLFDRRRCR